MAATYVYVYVPNASARALAGHMLARTHRHTHAKRIPQMYIPRTYHDYAASAVDFAVSRVAHWAPTAGDRSGDEQIGIFTLSARGPDTWVRYLAVAGRLERAVWSAGGSSVTTDCMGKARGNTERGEGGEERGDRCMISKDKDRNGETVVKLASLLLLGCHEDEYTVYHVERKHMCVTRKEGDKKLPQSRLHARD
jgi:hypothetical protein